MRNLTKKSLVTILAVVLMCVSCVFCVLHFGKATVNAQADGNVTVGTAEIPEESNIQLAENGEFNLLDEASVRIESDGIRFEAKIAESFYNEKSQDGSVDVQLLAVVRANGKVGAYPFEGTPVFEGNEGSKVFNFKTYLNFKSLANKSEAEKKAAYAMEFIVESYLKVGEGDSAVYYKACQSNGEVKRTMRDVATAAYFNYQEGQDFDKESVKAYFDIEESDTNLSLDSYSFGTDGATFRLPDTFDDPENGEKINVYLNAKTYEATYDANEDVYTISTIHALIDAQNTVSVVQDGKVFVSKIVQATKLTKDNLNLLKEATTGAFVLTEDIDLNGEVWQDGETQKRNLIFDGNGHSIKNIAYIPYEDSTNTYNFHCFFTDFGGIIRNTYFDISNVGGNYRGLIGRIRGETTIENVVVSYDVFGPYNGGGIGVTTNSNVTLKNVLINFGTFSCDGSDYGAIVGGHSGSSSAEITTENVYIVNPSKNTLSNLSPVSKLNGISGEDYFVYDSFETVGEKALENQLDEGINALVKDNLTFALNQDNIDMLKAATIGYYYLTDDIDMDGIVWDPSADFSGVLNGKDFEISNFTATAGFNDGLFQYTEDGAIIKNLNLHEVTNTTYGLLAGQVRGRTLLNNVAIDVDTLDCSYSSGCITSVVQGELTVKDSIFNIDNATGSATTVGFIAGGQSPSNEVIVDNVWAFVPTAALATPYRATATDKEGNPTDEFYTKTTSGEIASNGNGYNVYAITTPDELVYFDTKIIPDPEIKAYADKIIPEKDAVYGVTRLTNENFAVLQSALSGYYILVDDINMTKVDCNGSAEGLGTWTPTHTSTTAEVFNGTLNGYGHKIIGFTSTVGNSGLFGWVGAGAIIKNLYLQATSVKDCALMGQSKGSGVITVENVVIDIDAVTDGTRSGPIAGVVQGEITVKDCLFIIDSIPSSTTSGYVSGGEASNKNIILSNVYAVDKTGTIKTPYAPSYDGYSATGTHFCVNSLEELYDYKVENKINDKVLALIEKYDILDSVNVIELTKENFTLLQTAT
ncbi:MAG: hypothetical protein IJD54_00370, partial [Clostridia bacterium]|nr:hypothetical protein [Clostridia bacterium]